MNEIDEMQIPNRKRKHQDEEESSKDQQNTSEQKVTTLDPPMTPLTKWALKKLERQTDPRTVDDRQCEKPEQSLSSGSSTPEIAWDVSTVSSPRTYTLADYRWNTLKRADLLIEHDNIPQHVDNRIEAIIHPDLSPSQKETILLATETLCEKMSDAVNGASHALDFIQAIKGALESLDTDGSFKMDRKAAWHPYLKPKVQPSTLDWDMLPAADATSEDSSHVNNITTIHTPKPAITIGLRSQLLIDRSSALGIPNHRAEFCLGYWKLRMTATSPIYNILFPFLVVEAKPYSYGHGMFEARNQAAVAGSCMFNLQERFAKFANSGSSKPHPAVEPLAFSICAKGASMELWVHYVTGNGDLREYHMNVVKVCYVARRPALRREVEDFLSAIFGVMRWASTEFLEGLTERFVSLCKSAKEGLLLPQLSHRPTWAFKDFKETF
ncbi:MAG: hypothetical protein Q9222_004955 [Ikaeria aurantiellina]